MNIAKWLDEYVEKSDAFAKVWRSLSPEDRMVVIRALSSIALDSRTLTFKDAREITERMAKKFA